MSGNIRLYNTNGYVELQAPSSASAQVLELPTDSIKPALVHLHTESFSSVSSVSIDDVFSSTYDNYRVSIKINTSLNAELQFRLRASGSSYSGNDYHSQRLQANSTTVAGYRWSPQTYATIGHARGGYQTALHFDIYSPYMTERKGIVSQNTYALSSEIQAAIYNSGINTSVAYDGMELLLSTGTVDGTIRIYGYRNS